MTPFMPEGEIARWRIIYDLIRQLEPGEVITYEVMAEALKMRPKVDRHIIQMAARRALKELLDVDHRGADAVKNVGYRVAMPMEHLGLAQKRGARAGRQVAHGLAVSTKVDLNGVDDATRGALETLAHGFAVQGEINRRMLAKQKEHDDLIAVLMSRVERLEKE